MSNQTSGTPPVPSTTNDTSTARSSATENTSQRSKKEKKPGFFARWKESTRKGYDAHRAAGGNL